jgi:peptidyl-prolyl cis-trans isomerase SurA
MNKQILTTSLLLPFALLTIGSAVAQKNNDAVLMTIGSTKVTVAEFVNVYHKNNTTATAAANENKSLNDYVDLFVNFKLKVKEAEELKLDTAKSFKDELAGYRKQLAQPYLTDKDVNEKLLKETYGRLEEDVKASHILVKVSENALPKDTLAAYNKIMKIRERVLKGEDFNKVASEKGISDDPNGGDLGYFTALQMVYPFESAAYNTKVGEISMPVRTRYGYHIVKVTDRRKAQGEVLVAHIMVKAQANASKEDSLNAYTKITEIYNKLKAGSNFEELATQFSDDKQSSKKGGQLQWFGTNRMPAEFEKTSFALKTKGDYSQPIKTKYGWHIIKLIDKRGLASFDDMKNELKEKVSKDSRSQVGRASLIAKIKKEYKCKENAQALSDFYPLMDSTLFEGRWEPSKAKSLKKTMFNFNDKVFTQTDFANYIASHQGKRPKMDVRMLIDQLYKQFEDETAIAYEEGRLDQKYPEFKALMEEYHDGILLFQLTDQKVWSKAVKDTTGSKEFYEKNKANYMWDERADATVYSCSNQQIANQVRTFLNDNKAGKDIQAELNKDSQLNLQVESRTFSKGENEFVDKNWKAGISPDIVSEKDKKVIIVAVNKIQLPGQKTYQDARGLVTADYQNYLEKQWLTELKKKYAVTIDKNVLATIK